MSLPPFTWESAQKGPESAPVSPVTATYPGASSSGAPGTRPKRKGRPPSIGIRLGNDGRADTANMTQEQLSKIRSAISGTNILTADEKKALEIERQARIQTIKPFCAPLLKLFGSIESAIVKKSRKLTQQQADIFLYTDDEIAVLQEPTAAVIAKHGAGIEKWSEELTLVAYVVQIFHAKVNALEAMLEREKKQKSEQAQRRENSADVRSMEAEAIPAMTNGAL